MARSTQRKRFRAWAKARGLDLGGSESVAYKVWLHCRLEAEANNKATKEIIADVRKELESLYD